MRKIFSALSKKPKCAIPSVTRKGEQVKSRSEKRVADVLNKYNIEYRYETPLKMGKYTFAPDFYLPEFGIYLEFFGMLKNKEYRKKTIWKRQTYRKNRVKLISMYPKHVWKRSDKQIIKFILAGIKTLNNIS